MANDFQWALDQLEAGNRVRATYWSEWAMYLYAAPMPHHRYDQTKKHIFVKTCDGTTLWWRSRPYDEETAEWVIVTDDMLPDLMGVEPRHRTLVWSKMGK